MTTNIITVDGTLYNVRVSFGTMERNFELVEGNNKGVSITKREIRDVVGTRYSYSMDIEPDPAYPEDYDAFYEKITEPVDYHTVGIPYGQDGIEFEAQIISGRDSYKGFLAGSHRWGGLSVEFIPMQPQRM